MNQHVVRLTAAFKWLSVWSNACVIIRWKGASISGKKDAKVERLKMRWSTEKMMSIWRTHTVNTGQMSSGEVEVEREERETTADATTLDGGQWRSESVRGSRHWDCRRRREGENSLCRTDPPGEKRGKEGCPEGECWFCVSEVVIREALFAPSNLPSRHPPWLLLPCGHFIWPAAHWEGD